MRIIGSIRIDELVGSLRTFGASVEWDGPPPPDGDRLSFNRVLVDDNDAIEALSEAGYGWAEDEPIGDIARIREVAIAMVGRMFAGVACQDAAERQLHPVRRAA